MTTSTLSYLGLGTNLGDRIQNLRSAQTALPPQVQVLRASRIYETPPWGFIAQPAFLNQVLEVQTGLAPLALLEYLKKIEVDLGRIPTFRYGPRQIDIDILSYADQIIEYPNLTIPHPRLSERAFMLVPLAELAPDWVHPVLNQTIHQILTQVDSSGVEVSNLFISYDIK
jgi:2-amino-4-hydroxy-6-hydroxymethyldihydropteridine diphosphokinase